MSIFSKIKNKIRSSYATSEIALTRFSLLALAVVLLIVVISSVFFRPQLEVPEDYDVAARGSFSSEAFDITYSIEFDKYYVFIKYGANKDFAELKKDVEEVLVEFADIDDVSQIKVEYIDDRGVIEEDPHEEEGGLTFPGSDELN